MNNQITMLDRNEQSMNVELICYFSSGSKKYLFYTKNETVQDGLIKMYVAEENNGLSNDITADEWTGLKKIMQGIITGGAVDVKFLQYNNSIKINEGKAIALNDSNINAIKTAYKNNVEIDNSAMLNKDLLSQSFSNNIEIQSNIQEPVQITSIPQNQNSLDMESIPVNLNTTPVEQTIDNPFDSIPKIEPIESGVLEAPVLNANVEEAALSINNIKPSGIESDFKVSNEPNIFDQPVDTNIINVQEVNQPANDIISPVLENNNVVKEIEQPTNSFTNTSLFDINNNINSNEVSNNSNNINVDKKIALNERKIKLFEELASIYKEENELLKNGDTSVGNSALENTASNLFNNNGTLNDNEVLG